MVESKGVVRDGHVFVPSRLFAETFMGDFRSTSDYRSLFLLSDKRRIRFQFNDEMVEREHSKYTELPAILVDGEAYIPLAETADSLEVEWSYDSSSGTVTLTRQGRRALVNLVQSDTAITPLSAETALTVYKRQSNGLTYSLKKHIDPKRTAILVIDFWGDRIDPAPELDNAATLVHFARQNGIFVVHDPHEGLELPGYRINPRILPIPETDGVLTNGETIDDYFDRKSIEIDTILLAGFSAEECLLFSRSNSITNISRRSARFDLILVKDATTASYWGYEFALDGIEMIYSSTTLKDVAKAFGTITSALPVNRLGYSQLRKARTDTSFGASFRNKKTALVIINPMGEPPKTRETPEGWFDRVQDNIERNIAPLLAFARERGLHVVFVPNGHPIDPKVSPGPGEASFDSVEGMNVYLKKNEIEMILYSGNLTNTEALFRPLDVNLFSSFDTATRLVEDALIVSETPESLANQHFKRYFLERATVYGGKRHMVTTSATLRSNLIFSAETRDGDTKETAGSPNAIAESSLKRIVKQ
ncbi:stalk domain-containing protein [Rhodoplanes elegans]